jgi:hypothetical protein
MFLLFKLRVLVLKKTWYTSEYAKRFLLFGFFILLNMFILHALVLGVGGYIYPNFPSLVGIGSIAFYCIGGLTLRIGSRLISKHQSLWLASFLILLLFTNILRMRVLMPKQESELVKQTKLAAADISLLLGGKEVAYLWLDHVNIHDLNFYITQTGGIPIDATSGLSPDADTEMPPQKDKNIALQQNDFASGLRNRKYVVIIDDLSLYENPDGFFFILKYGKPVVEGILNDPRMEKIYSFKAGARSFSVFKNNSQI